MKPCARTIAILASLAPLVPGCGSSGPGGQVPEEAVRRNARGIAYFSQQKWDEARAEFEQALQLRPEDPVLLVNIAIALVQQGRNDDAEAYLRRALQADPDDVYAHYNLGLIEKSRGNAPAAAEHFARVVEADPDDAAARYNLASALARLDRLDEAEAHFRAALERNPAHVSALYGLGRLLLQQGRQAEGAALVARSQEARARGGADTAMGTQYGEQGPYAMGVDYPAGGLPAPEPIEVRFAVREGALPAAAPEGARVLAEALGAPEGWHVAVGDVDGDGILECVGIRRHGSSWVSARAPRCEGLPSAQAQPLALPGAIAEARAGASLVDRDHDGDLDLYGCAGDAERAVCFVYDNDGSGSFREPERDPGFGVRALPGAPVLGFSDLDNDRDVDLILATPGGLHLFDNRRDGTFADTVRERGLAGLSGIRALAVADLDRDRRMDLVLASEAGVSVAFNRRARFEVEPLGPDPAEASAGLVVFDYDNDGFLDVLAAGKLWRNLGTAGWTEVSALALPQGFGARARLAADLDGDGDLDLLAQGEGGRSVWLENQGGNARRWAAVSPKGVRDNRFGIGTKVEVLAGASMQKFEVAAPLPVHAGLGGRERVDAVRLLWPGGVLQDELDVPAGRVNEIAQLDRKGTSCPLLYAWRDGKWRFVTDFLGGSAVGYRHDPHTLSVPDTDEYILIEGGLDQEGGRLRLRFNNQLEEAIWFDQAELVVVDHPAGTEVYPNERLMPGPPWPEFALYASGDIRPIRRAVELETGRDVTAQLAERDRRYADGFELLPFKGYAEMHTLELDLGQLPRGTRLVLLLDGWIDYADSSANIAAYQAGRRLVPPRLHAADGQGGWRDLSERMGFPAGLPKTMAVDLSGAFPAEDFRIRIATNMRIYWDRARVMVGGENTPLQVRRLAPARADLRYGGFPLPTSPDGRPPFGYDPERVAWSSPWKAHAGVYTPFGDVTARLRARDDRFVTTRNGDEIEIEFAAPPPPPPGFVRTHLVYADGFGKDMDPNSAAHSDLAPLPFHGMPGYPYGPEITPPPQAVERHGRRVLHPDDGYGGAIPLVLRLAGPPAETGESARLPRSSLTEPPLAAAGETPRTGDGSRATRPRRRVRRRAGAPRGPRPRP